MTGSRVNGDETEAHVRVRLVLGTLSNWRAKLYCRE